MNQRGFIPVALIPYLVCGALAAGAGGYAIYIYKDRANLIMQLENIKVESARLLAAREEENKKLKIEYDQKAKDKDTEYAKTIATIRARANAATGIKLYDPGQGCSGAGQAGKDSTGSVEGSATGRELSGKLTEFLVTEATRADEVKAYADTCHAWANWK